jgi:hypothetical protein
MSIQEKTSSTKTSLPTVCKTSDIPPPRSSQIIQQILMNSYSYLETPTQYAWPSQKFVTQSFETAGFQL